MPEGWIRLYCPQCGRSQSAPPDETDPPNLAIINVACPDCNPLGDRELIDYFDAEGHQIDLDGNRVNDEHSNRGSDQ